MQNRFNSTDPRWPLGADVIDRVSGLRGVITAVAYHLNNEVQAQVTPRAPCGTRLDAYWLPLDRLDDAAEAPVSR